MGLTTEELKAESEIGLYLRIPTYNPESMRFEEARNHLFDKLEKELPANLNYHNIQHTRDVLSACEELAAAENLSGNDLILLKTAAVYHDAGFLRVYDGHEEESCKMVAAMCGLLSGCQESAG
jgi:HD superfamily phosphodiesterase